MPKPTNEWSTFLLEYVWLQSGKPSLYDGIGGRGILQNFPYWFFDFLWLLGLTGTAIDPALDTTPDHIWAFLLLKLTGTMTDPVLDTALDRIRAFLLLELSVTATDLALDRILLISYSLALALNAALAIFMLTWKLKIKLNKIVYIYLVNKWVQFKFRNLRNDIYAVKKSNFIKKNSTKKNWIYLESVWDSITFALYFHSFSSIERDTKEKNNYFVFSPINYKHIVWTNWIEN